VFPYAVEAQTPTLSSTLTPPAICSGQTFNYLPSSATPATGFTWTFVPTAGITITPDTVNSGQGAISLVLTNATSAAIPVTFQYTLTSGTKTNTQNVTVVVNPVPVPNFTLASRGECLTGNSFSAVNASSGGTGALRYGWALGDGATATTTNVTHTYGAPGIFQIRLTATDRLGCSAVLPKTVTVYPEPVADFTDLLQNPYTTDAYQFTNTSAGGVTSYAWNFGDGSPVNTTANPAHTFPAAGATYQVTLTVTDAQGCTTSFTENIVTPTVATTGAADFISSASVGGSQTSGLCEGSVFFFTDHSTNAASITAFSWDYGDGTALGAGASVNHTYSAAGTYTVTETVTYPGGAASVSQLINVYPSPVLTIQPTALATICSGGFTPPITFLPTNDALQFNWTVSDTSIGLVNGGGSSISPFAAKDTGTAQVSSTIVVSAVSPYGCPIASKSITLAVNPSPVMPGPLPWIEVCSGSTITVPAFVASPAGTTFTWTNSNPVTGLAASGTGNIAPFTGTNYAPAPDPSTLRITPVLNGCRGAAQQTVFTVDPTPTMDTLVSGMRQCSGQPFLYTPGSTALGTTFSWTRAATPGITAAPAAGIDSITEVLTSDTTAPVDVTYQYLLTVGKCATTQPVTVQIEPIPVLTSPLDTSLCSGALFRYQPLSATPGTTFAWTRDAVSGISNAAGTGVDSVREVLEGTGFAAVPVDYQYTVSAVGCSKTQDLRVTVNPVPVVTVPTPATQVLCPGSPTLPVTFTVNPAGTTYTWTNSNAAIGLNPSGSNAVPSFTAVNASGSPVSANIQAVAQTAAGCSSAPSAPYVFTINPAPVAGLTADDGTLWCPGTPLQFVASGGASYQWMLAGNALPGATNAALGAVDSGFYSVAAINTYGCADTTGIAVSLYPKPQASFIFATSCLDTPVVFTNTSSETGNLPVTYAWSDNAGNTSSAMSPVFTYTRSGQYSVSLVVAPQGCAAEAATYTQPIEITRPIPGERLPDEFVQSGLGAPISGRSFGGAAYDWAPAVGLSDPTVSDPSALLTGQQLYTIAMTFPTGCVTTDTLRVDLIPKNLVYIPNTFTPNGDGHNDLFVIAGLNNYPGSSLAVFDRWGKQVYFASAYQNNWDGGGQPQGVYVYVLELKYEGGGKIYRGTLTMVR
jgi:gliding motility-associated-like protein